jgi:hypothetical protein
MNEPARKTQKPHLEAVSDDHSKDSGVFVETNDEHLFKGGGGGPPQPPKTSEGPGMLFYTGLILVLISGFALSKDAATATYRQKLISFGELRVSLELMFMATGFSLLFTAIGVMQARHAARRIERQSGNQVKSLTAKRLDKVSDGDLLAVICNYFSTIFH